MAAARAPRSLKSATVLLERFADVDGRITVIEAARRAELVEVNARFDAQAAALVAERDDLSAKLKAWWLCKGHELTLGKRKSLAIGGCEIGSRLSPATLQVAGDADKIALALQKKSWAGELVRTTVSIERAAVLKSIDGAHAKELAKLGFSRIDGVEMAFVKRVAQAGTLAATAAG
ncbi:MAG TPA: host-nuclease inhibitor Gam family protein [Sphingopyxis sp.]|nr:host-nuclease inhibitor Gam family protein [Sphingopyxis sp.]HMP43917.1 host-nuclease inhibitor Gam family protein [Sphingopyxis sp.]HMQ18084.1 host-nuclease inhibitor Gam family protein [Sphingopyxis sp.]